MNKPSYDILVEKDCKIICKCGHNHVSYIGDMEEKEGYHRIHECEMCSCERWEEKNESKN